MSGGETRRPNVLVIIADQLRADHLGFAGNQVVRTPHLDRLAAQSMVFTEATVTNPTCMPNRASLLTGRWPSTHGTRCNGITMDPDANNLVKQLSCGGYLTRAVGKLHHQNMGWDFEPIQRAEIEATDPLLLDPRSSNANTQSRPEGWDQWENAAAHAEDFIPLPEGYYGYQQVDLVIGHGDRPGGHYVHWARERGIDPVAVGGAENAPKRLNTWDQVYQTGIPAELHPSSYVGERAEAHLAEFAESAEPFFMFVSFPDPHHPFSPPEGYADMYSPDEVELPIGFYQDHAKSPSHIHRMFDRRGEPNEDPTMTFAADEAQYRQAAAAHRPQQPGAHADPPDRGGERVAHREHDPPQHDPPLAHLHAHRRVAGGARRRAVGVGGHHGVNTVGLAGAAEVLDGLAGAIRSLRHDG